MKNINVLGVISARLNSSRLPAKHMLPLAGKPMIERIFQILEKVVGVDEWILSTTANTSNVPLVKWAEKNDKHHFIYDEDDDDLIGRTNAIVQEKNPNILIHVFGDTTIIDSETVSSMLALLQKTPNAKTVRVMEIDDKNPSIHAGFDIYRKDFWYEIVKKSITVIQKEYVGIFSDRLLGKKDVAYYKDDPIYSSIWHRLSIDTFSDYEFMENVYQRWYGSNKENSIVSLKWLIGQIKSDTSLRLLNQHVCQQDVEKNHSKVLLVTQASSTDGIGHLKRMVWLMRALQDFYAISVKLHILGEVFSANWLDFLPHQWHKNKNSFLNDVTTEYADILVYDLNPRNYPKNIDKVLMQQQAKGVRQVSIDAMAEYHQYLDLVCIPSFYLSEKNKDIPVDKLLYGWNCYLMDYRVHEDHVYKRHDEGTSKNLLIITGGSDSGNFSEWLPLKIERLLPKNTVINWVQGPFSKSPIIPKYTEHFWNIHHSPENIKTLMEQTDIALTRHGVSFFELAALGVPTWLMLDDEVADKNELFQLMQEPWVFVLKKWENWPNLMKNRDVYKDAIKVSQDGAIRLAERLLLL
jgi:spore coat polysaccharide biosynthesis protein SpsF (cytidylyltransferase family)/spore coat polysaccharide biosynthesis predicted glycosyltransferase SpsG